MARVLKDWRTAPVSEKKRAALEFLTKYVPPEEDFGLEDIEKLRKAGLSEQEIKDVMYVGFSFMTMSKAADAFGWPPHAPGVWNDKTAKNFLSMPYKMMALPG